MREGFGPPFASSGTAVQGDWHGRRIHLVFAERCGVRAAAHSNRGIAYSHQGKLDEAIADYTQAITLDPKYAFAYANRGNTYKAQGKLDLAIADYTQAIALDLKYANAYANRGIVYYFQKQWSQALADWEMARKLGAQFTPEIQSLYDELRATVTPGAAAATASLTPTPSPTTTPTP